MNERLKFIFENVNSWLSFAEAKNGALVALDVAILAGVTALGSFDVYNCFWVFVIIAVCTSMMISLISFIPFTGNKSEKFMEIIIKKDIQSATKNYLFYTYIASYKSTDSDIRRYLLEMASDYNERNYQVTLEDYDIASEIICNAKLVLRKYKLFKIALLILFFTTLALCIAVILA